MRCKHTLNVSLARTFSARTSVITRSKVERIFIASWGSIRPSLIRSSSVSVRERPRLRQATVSGRISRAPLRGAAVPAPAIQLVISLSTHGDDKGLMDCPGGDGGGRVGRSQSMTPKRGASIHVSWDQVTRTRALRQVGGGFQEYTTFIHLPSWQPFARFSHGTRCPWLEDRNLQWLLDSVLLS